MMQLFHQAVRSLRATLAAPLRRGKLQRLAVAGKAPLSVLFYHRVADTHPNAWTLSEKNFQRHIDYCSSNLQFVDLAEVQRRVRVGGSHAPAVSITFDDGYRDNCDFALPLLIERGIPCTYFVTTSSVQKQSAFAHDERRGRPLAVNTVGQIRDLSDAGIEIACHTRHHVDFSLLYDPDEVTSEIIDAKDELEQMIGKRVRYFAFPYGMPQHLTQLAIEAVHEAGFDGFCSAYGGYNLVGRDAFHIRRFHGDPEFARFKNWLLFDERKVRSEPDVRYFLPPQDSFQPATTAMMALETAVPLSSHPIGN